MGQVVPAAGAQTPRKRGTLFKDEVDAAIDLLRRLGRQHGWPAIGGTSVTATAQVLCAMGHCHRRYHISDGPVVRGSLEFLTRNRKADGSYGDAVATSWVVEALSVIDPDGHREEIAQAKAWLARTPQAAAVPASGMFADRVGGVLGAVRFDRFPEHIGADAAQALRNDLQAAGEPKPEAVAALLLELVACQAANRRLDQAQGAGGATFSPAQQKAFDWLLQQQKEGKFLIRMRGQEFADPALTGFGLLALQTKPKQLRTKAEQDVIDQGLNWLLLQQNEDGSFGKNLPNYTTCVVVGALARWDNPAAKAVMDKAQRCILAFQNAEGNGYQKSDRDYGSIGYGGAQRGDLSNLHFSLEALRATGLPANHEAFAKALVFLQRTQNLPSVNDFSGKVPDPDREGVVLDATSGVDGGAAYYPGNSAAGYIVTPDGKSMPRSYGSMTYALLKSYTLAGVSRDDPRMQAAVKWIQQNWTLAVNPGADPALGEKVQYQGLFYYYMVLAQALAGVGIEQVEVPGADGKVEAVDWRKALRTHLEGIQQADGTWVNGKNERWMENLPLLCTCYAMAALEHCR